MCPSEGALEAEADVDEAHELLESGDTQAALSKMADALAADPTNDDARFDYVRLLIATGGYEGGRTPCCRNPSSAFPSRCASMRCGAGSMPCSLCRTMTGATGRWSSLTP